MSQIRGQALLPWAPAPDIFTHCTSFHSSGFHLRDGGRCLGSRQKQKPPIAGGGEVKQVREITSTQVRLPADLYAYIKTEADRMGIAQNAFLVILAEMGRKSWEAKVITYRQEG